MPIRYITLLNNVVNYNTMVSAVCIYTSKHKKDTVKYGIRDCVYMYVPSLVGLGWGDCGERGLWKENKLQEEERREEGEGEGKGGERIKSRVQRNLKEKARE